MIEALPHFVPARSEGVVLPDGTTLPLAPTPNNYPNLPYHLRKFVLRRIEREIGAVGAAPFWQERAMYIEQRVQNLVSTIPGVQNLVRHEQYTAANWAGNDLSFEMAGQLIHVEVKSSRFTIREFKRGIRDRYFKDDPNSEELVNKWLTKNKIILVNGSETRSDEDILDGSFYPQLKRIRSDIKRAA
jgi:hypothetical protein